MKYPLFGILFLFLASLTASAQSMFDKVNDFDGDGKADYAITRNENGQKIWHLLRSTAGYAGVAWGLPDDFVTAGDYDGDGKTDLAIYRPASPQSTYWVLGSTAGFSGFGFGIATDAPVTY